MREPLGDDALWSAARPPPGSRRAAARTARTGTPQRSGSMSDAAKRAAAEQAAELVRDGMRVGLGTGSTVAHLLPALAARGLRDLRCVATSVATERRGARARPRGRAVRRRWSGSTSPSTAPTRSRPTAG